MTRNDPQVFDPALYDADFFTWTQQQAAALRAMPRDALVDIEHVSEEIEDLGKRDLREVGSFLSRLIEHLLKLDACPLSRDAAHWWSEASHFQSSAFAAFSPGMRQLLDIDRIWAMGCKAAAKYLRDLETAPQTPTSSPFMAQDLLSAEFDIDTALAKIAVARDTPHA